MKYPLFIVVAASMLVHDVARAETLTISGSETAGMSMFRGHWNEPIPLAEGGARASWNYKDYFTNGRGQYAVWSREKRQGQPGALAFDALNRSLLVRFPDAAEKIAAVLKKGNKSIAKAEIILPFEDEELFPPAPQPDRPGPDSYEFRGTFGTFEAWKASRPTWHAVAYALRKPWMADEELGPTFNAAINGSLYWSKYGAQDPENDRVPLEFGPVEVSYRKPEGRLDVTAALTQPEFGKTLVERLRRFADNGFLVQKWETYDHRYFNGVYEAPTATGSRAILITAPQLVVTFTDGSSENVAALPPPIDIDEVAKRVVANGTGGAPTALMPTAEEIRQWAALERLRPKWADDTQWARILELFTVKDPNATAEPFWNNFIAPHLIENIRGVKMQNGQKIFTREAQPEETFALWVDKLIGRPVRGWSGFEVAREWSEWSLGQEILPEPAKDAIRRYWSSWLMPDRENSPEARRRDPAYFDGPLVHPMVEHPGVNKDTQPPEPAKGRFDAYWENTGDWRGNKSFYRSGFNYDISTQNFNTTASVGSFVFSGIIDSELARKDGVHGVNKWLVRGWVWSDGSGQEHFDHYYYAITLAGLKTLQNAANTPDTRLLADGLVTKGVEEAIAAWHPKLKRFIAPASRTSLEFLLGTQDGGNFIMNTMSRESVLTDIGTNTLPGGIPVIGHELPPALVAQLTLPSPWAYGPAADMVEDKPLPWEAIHWGSGTWRKAYFGQNYGLAAQLTGGPRIQAMAQWRREAADVKSALDLSTLDIRGGINETRWVNDAGGWIKQNYRQVVVQDGNRWLALMNPSGVAGMDDVKSIQYSLGFFDIRETGPTWEIFIDGKKVESLPVTARQGQKIVLRDGVTYVGVIPFPSTDLGRDAEVVIEQGRVQKYDQYKADVGPALVFNSYLYKSNEALPKDIDPYSVRSAVAGYTVQFSDASEMPFPKFLELISSADASITFNPEERLVTARWKIGGDTLEAVYESVPGVGAKADALSKFEPQVVSTTKNGEPLYPEKNILRDTPVTQMAWDRAEKGGAVAESKAGRGNRVFLQSFPDDGVFTYWNPQGIPADVSLKLPSKQSIISDGFVGLCRIQVDTKNKTVMIDCVPLTGRDGELRFGAASAFLLDGFDPAYKVTLNGVLQKTPLAEAAVNGRKVNVLPMQPGTSVRTPQQMEEILQLFARAQTVRANASENIYFVQADFAGPFPVEAGVYGPEKTPGIIDLSASYADGLGGQPVRWKNLARLNKDARGALVKSPQDGYAVFNSHHAQSTAPCSYYATAILRSDEAKEATFEVNLSTFPDMAPKAVALWVNGQPVEITQERKALALVSLQAGENVLLVKIVQDQPREPRTADKLTLKVSDPVLMSPMIEGLAWKGAGGEWIAFEATAQ